MEKALPAQCIEARVISIIQGTTLGQGAIAATNLLEAIAEFGALPYEHPLRSNALELLNNLLANLQTGENLEEDLLARFREETN